MPNYTSVYPMVLNNVFIGMINLRSDVIGYFGIPAPTPAEEAAAKYVKARAAHTRNIRRNRLDSRDEVESIQVTKGNPKSKQRGKLVKRMGGKAIKVPTDLRNRPAPRPSTDAGATVIRAETVVYTTIRFPGTASMDEISAWLKLKLVTHPPASFQSPAGKSYAVAGLAAGAVPDGGGTTP